LRSLLDRLRRAWDRHYLRGAMKAGDER
jgi:hypothetical protein